MYFLPYFYTRIGACGKARPSPENVPVNRPDSPGREAVCPFGADSPAEGMIGMHSISFISSRQAGL